VFLEADPHAFEHISLPLLQLAEVNTQERICKS
jgi:hypothetical protein